MKVLAVIFAALTLAALPAHAASERVSYSLQALALAPNAGGQTAYSLRRATDSHEYSLFANTYLTAGGRPLLGAAYDWRFPICGQDCFWQLFTQVGLGVTTAGPIAEVTWGSVPFWLLRVDITTQLIFIPRRAITWSYPLWVGISVPAFW